MNNEKLDFIGVYVLYEKADSGIRIYRSNSVGINTCRKTVEYYKFLQYH